MISGQTVHSWVAEATAGPRFGFSMGVLPDWGEMVALVQAAEAVGFDGVFLPDHPLMGWDSWTCLGALAQATSRVRLGMLVTCAHYRNPVVLARAVADVDRISGGRVVLGLGSGDLPFEFQQMGLAYPSPRQRAAVLEEVLKVVPALLRGDRVEFTGEMVTVAGANLRPPAPQRPHVPILIAGGGERTILPPVAEYADASNLAAASWAGCAFSAAEAGRKLGVLSALCEGAGRPSESVLRTYQIGFFLADTREAAAAMRGGLRGPVVCRFSAVHGSRSRTS